MILIERIFQPQKINDNDVDCNVVNRKNTNIEYHYYEKNINES